MKAKEKTRAHFQSPGDLETGAPSVLKSWLSLGCLTMPSPSLTFPLGESEARCAHIAPIKSTSQAIVWASSAGGLRSTAAERRDAKTGPRSIEAARERFWPPRECPLTAQAATLLCVEEHKTATHGRSLLGNIDRWPGSVRRGNYPFPVLSGHQERGFRISARRSASTLASSRAAAEGDPWLLFQWLAARQVGAPSNLRPGSTSRAGGTSKSRIIPGSWVAFLFEFPTWEARSFVACAGAIPVHND